MKSEKGKHFKSVNSVKPSVIIKLLGSHFSTSLSTYEPFAHTEATIKKSITARLLQVGKREEERSFT